jgi:flagellar biosynthetic protein FliR
MSLFSVTDAELSHWVAGVMWPFVRISALLAAAPLFGARTVPVRVRAALAFLIALLVAPIVATPGEVEILSATGAVAIGREALIGLGLGFLTQMMFAALAMAGEIVALSTGLAFATIVDPERGNSVPLLGQYYVILATLLFLALDGHLALLDLLVRSFEPLPAGALGITAAGWWELVGWGSQMYRGAVHVALPAATAVLLANVSIGMMARSAPQLNVFAVGFPITMLLGIVFLLFSLPALDPQLGDLLADVLSHGAAVLGAPPGGGPTP